MTVQELIKQLHKLQLPNAKVVSYEPECDDYVEVTQLNIADNGNKLRMDTQYAIDAGYV